MPVPFLPFDVIAAIVSHEEEEDIDHQEQISIGKSVSLVSRSWLPPGQALRWRRVEIIPEQISSLADHFAQHPHLVTFVRTLKVAPATHEVESSESLFGRQLPDLLRSFLNLRVVSIAGELGEDLSTIIGVLSSCQGLKEIVVDVEDNLEWTNDLSSTFRQGFRQLSILTFVADRFTPLDVFRQAGGNLPVKHLTLAWYGDVCQGTLFLRSVISTLELRTVQSVALAGFLTHCSFFDQLLLFPILQQLDISCLWSDASSTFSTILPFLPRFPSLRRFEIDYTQIDASPSIQSPVTVSIVLGSFPPSLEQFEAPQFVFPDFGALPIRPISTTSAERRHPTLEALYPLNAEQTETRNLIVWGEQGEGGRTRWYRDVDSEDEKQSSCRHDFHPLAFSMD